MSLLPAAHAIIAARPAKDPLRITLEEMIRGGHIGSGSPITLPNIVARIAKRGVTLSDTHWQTTVLKESRVGTCFIGSGPRGYFIIDSREDALVMQAFYLDRILSEMEHLSNLRRQVTAQCGWVI